MTAPDQRLGNPDWSDNWTLDCVEAIAECYQGRMKGHVERIEQAGSRITITMGGLVHDMICDGTLENGVDDTAGFGGPRIRVAANFDDGVHKMRPFGKKIVAVTRRLDGDEMMWRYGPDRNRLRRMDRPLSPYLGEDGMGCVDQHCALCFSW